MSRYTTEGGLQATLDFGFQARATGFAHGRPDHRAARPVRRRRLLHRHRLQRLLAADVPRQPRHGPHRPASSPTAATPATSCCPRPARPLADVPARAASRSSTTATSRASPATAATRTPARTCSPSQVDVVQRRRPDRHRRHHRRRQLRHRPPAVPAPRRAVRAARRSTRRSPTAPRSTATPAATPASTRSAASTPTTQREYVVVAQQQRAEPRRSRSTRSRRDGDVPRAVAGRHRASVRSDREGRVTVTVPPLSARRVARRSPTSTGERHAPAMFFRTPGPGGTVGGRAEVGVAVPDDGFNQVTIAWRPVGTDGVDAARHRRQRAVPGVPRRHRPREGHARRVPRRAPRPQRQPLGRPDVRDRRRSRRRRRRSAAAGGPVDQPDAVSVPGSVNGEMGCPGDWQPGLRPGPAHPRPRRPDLEGHVRRCPPATTSTRSRSTGRGTRTTAPAASATGPTSRSRTAGGPVTFYYDHGTHWVTTDVRGARSSPCPAASSPSSAARPTGRPDCMRPWLQDPDGDGTWTWSTTRAPGRVATRSRSPTGCRGTRTTAPAGCPNGANIPFTVPADGARVTFTLRARHARADHHHVGRPGRCSRPRPARGALAASGDLLAWDLPGRRRAAGASGCTPRPTGGLVVDEEAILGGESFPLTLDPAGLPADVPSAVAAPRRPTTPCGCRTRMPATPRALLTGQVAVAAYDDLGRLVDATGVQIPGVLDDVYDDAYDRDLGVTWRGSAPTFAVWAPTAKDVDLLLRPPGQSTDTRVATAPRRRRRVVGARGGREWAGATYLFEVDVYVPADGRGRDQPGHRPVRAGADDGLGPFGPRRPRRPVAAPGRLERRCASPSCASPRTRRSTSSTCATSRSATRPCLPTTAAPTSPSPTPAATGCSTCAVWPTPG